MAKKQTSKQQPAPTPARKPAPLMTFPGAHTKAVTALAFAPDGRTLVSGGGDHAIRLWEIASKECCAVIDNYHSWGLVALAFSPDGKIVASVSQGVKGPAKGHCRAVLWDLITRRLHAISLDGDPLLSFPAFTRDGSLLALKAEDKVWMFDARTGEVADQIPVPVTAYSMALSPDGKHLALGRDNGEVRIWDVSRKKLARTLPAQKGLIQRLAFSPDGALLASASSNRAPHGKPEGFLPPNADHTVQFWDFATGEPKGEAVEVGDSTACLTILADGRTWASIDGPGDEATVRQGKIGSPGQRAWTPEFVAVCSAAVAPDARLVALGDEAGTITVWEQDTPMKALPATRR